MCGIAGLLNTDAQRPADLAILRHMGDAVAHRGPDGEGLLVDRNLGMVHRRLAIIDLAGGDQPIANEDKTIHVVFNGEIYNFPQLRDDLIARGHQFRTHSDTEVLVHLYEEHGQELVCHLRGMFAFALWDQRRRHLLLARDHVGQKPLYVYRDDDKLLFGSELKSILAHPNVDRTIDSAAVEDYLTFGVIPGARSIFRRIQRLPAGHTLLVRPTDRHPHPQQYWQLSFDQEVDGSDDEWTERIDAAIEDSVRAHLLADVPVGAFLSGGLDSSTIVASLSQFIREPVQTFSIGFQEKKFSELPYAAAVAEHFGTAHTELIVTPEAVSNLDELVRVYDEPFADASAIPTMAVARLASRHVKVVLSGDGGDEAFGGYSRYAHDLNEAAIRDRLPAFIRRLILRPAAVIWPKADWLPRPLRLKTVLQNLSRDPAAAYANTLSQCRSEMRSRLLNPEFARRVSHHRPEDVVERAYRNGSRDALSGMLAADSAFLLPDDFLTKVDRASMAYGLEVRPPFIDVPLLELAAQMPSRMKVRRGCKKWILKELYESRLPGSLAHRPKQGFELPVNQWLRGPLRDQVQEVLLNTDSPIAQFVDTRQVDRLYAAHRQGTGTHGAVLWSLLVLGRWMQAWGGMDSSSAASAETRVASCEVVL